ncbi:putative TIM-barrel fold metal-dependent hydrolase [Catenulispora sp. GAS73]
MWTSRPGRGAVTGLADTPLSAEDRAKIAYGNAERILCLKV